MSAPSLELLTKKALKDAPPPPQVQTDDTVEIDLNTLSSDDIDQLVLDFNLETPDDWSNYNLDQKRQFLQANADDSSVDSVPFDAEEQDGPYLPLPEPAAEPPVTEDTAKEAMTELAATEKAKPKKKSKKAQPGSDLVATVEPMIGEIIEKDDVIVTIVHDIENLDESHAKKVLSELSDVTGKNYFKIGGVLRSILKNQWYKPNYATFKEYLEGEVGIEYRRAMYWITIYERLVESKVPWEKVKGVGWSKLIILKDIIGPDNIDEWVSIAMSQSSLQLAKTVKAASNKVLPPSDNESPTTSKSFKFLDYQYDNVKNAVEKAKGDGSTASDAAALSNICSAYLSSYDPAQTLKTIGLEAALDAFSKAFPEYDLLFQEKNTDEV